MLKQIKLDPDLKLLIMNNEIKIKVPAEHKVDLKNSNLSEGIIVFKETTDALDYQEVCYRLFDDRDINWITEDEYLINTSPHSIKRGGYNENLSLTKEQLESILALNQLANVAKYLNDGWLPNWNDAKEIKYFIYFNVYTNKLVVATNLTCYESSVFFKSIELAHKAIEILGEEVIKKALTLNH